MERQQKHGDMEAHGAEQGKRTRRSPDVEQAL